MELMEQFYYGQLRSMKKEYLERTIKSYFEELYPRDDVALVEIHTRNGRYDDNILGDDKVQILIYDDEGQMCVDRFVNNLCNEIAEYMVKDK